MRIPLRPTGRHRRIGPRPEPLGPLSPAAVPSPAPAPVPPVPPAGPPLPLEELRAVERAVGDGPLYDHAGQVWLEAGRDEAGRVLVVPEGRTERCPVELVARVHGSLVISPGVGRRGFEDEVAAGLYAVAPWVSEVRATPVTVVDGAGARVRWRVAARDTGRLYRGLDSETRARLLEVLREAYPGADWSVSQCWSVSDRVLRATVPGDPTDPVPVPSPAGPGSPGGVR
ncbi:hypothetical protein [Streptomyces sp. ST2-7A]|uniref:hypothetical protein n=1 Tax=Streptomyces sp. ST2-7A TaxID=2907214 RepID=UPI001F31858E|nr:hypothetical protein [Streptomyces sp. ST2-7A]MCE7083479.1 hypothetical protein [Streptomyces sp. ST2-7A]